MKLASVQRPPQFANRGHDMESVVVSIADLHHATGLMSKPSNEVSEDMGLAKPSVAVRSSCI